MLMENVKKVDFVREFGKKVQVISQEGKFQAHIPEIDNCRDACWFQRNKDEWFETEEEAREAFLEGLWGVFQDFMPLMKMQEYQGM